jgi:hypothetical protein
VETCVTTVDLYLLPPAMHKPQVQQALSVKQLATQHTQYLHVCAYMCHHCHSARAAPPAVHDRQVQQALSALFQLLHVDTANSTGGLAQHLQVRQCTALYWTVLQCVVPHRTAL